MYSSVHSKSYVLQTFMCPVLIGIIICSTGTAGKCIEIHPSSMILLIQQEDDKSVTLHHSIPVQQL